MVTNCTYVAKCYIFGETDKLSVSINDSDSSNN